MRERGQMRYRCLVLGGVVAAVVAVAWVPIGGQAPRGGAGTGAATWTPTRTAWGDPDLQGIWRGLEEIPFERPAKYEGRELLTDAEHAALEENRNAKNAERGAGKQENRGFREQPNYNAIVGYSPERIRVSRRTAAIVDPADGLLPPWTLEQVKRYEALEAATAGRGDADWTIDRPPGERCISDFAVPYVNNWGMGLGPGAPNVYHDFEKVIGNPEVNPGGDGISPNASPGGTRRFLQTPGYVVVSEEEGNNYHIISLDGRPHLGAKFQQYQGDQRGHWEGNTLVVETTNVQYFGPVIPSYGSAIHPSGNGETLRVVERYTRVGPDTMEYRVTVDDPAVYTKMWTVMHNLTRDDLYRVSPVPCREGIDDMGTTLYGWRLDEEQAMENAEETRVARKSGFERMKKRALEAANAPSTKSTK